MPSAASVGLAGEGVEVGFDREPLCEGGRQTAAHSSAGETEAGQAEARHLPCETHTGTEQIVVDEAVDGPELQGLLGHDNAAGRDHLEGAPRR